MSTHNICFRGEVRKILYGYPLLSVAMIAAKAVLTSTHIYVLSRNMKNVRVFYLKIFSFWRCNFLYTVDSRYLELTYLE